jgi:hypothetical protein
MPSLALAQIHLFRDSTRPRPIETLTLAEALAHIQEGMYRRRIEWLRRLTDPAAHAQAKRRLSAMTLAGVFAPRRGIAHLQQHSGIIHGDLDHLDDVEAVKRRLADDPRIVYIFISPSGTGLKVGLHVAPVASDAAYKHAWQAVADYCQRTYGLTWDPSGKDISRLCYVSWDPALYTKLDAEPFPVPTSALPAATPRPPQRPVTRLDTRYHGQAVRAVRTAMQMIADAQLGTRHHTRLRASRLLGGYVAGGLLSQEQAYRALAQALVGHTDDLERALKTVEDGLTYGQAYPITLDDLEAERGAWLAQHHTSQDREHPLPSGVPIGGTPFPTTLARQSRQIRTIPGKAVSAWR